MESSRSFQLRSSSINMLRLRRVFDLFDSNGDGEITPDELCRALNRLGLESSASELVPLVSAHVKLGRAGLDFDDFRGLHGALGDALFAGELEAEEGEDDSELTEAFKVFDVDGDGFISAWELQAVLGKLGFMEGREIGRVEDMICSFDRNKDGRVDFTEFKHMMQGFVSVYGS